MKFKYVNSISDTVAEMRLYDHIGMGRIDGSVFANELEQLSNSGFEKINVRINSGGGNVQDGLSIFSAIHNSKSEVNTYIDGVAASIAGIIAQSGKKRYIASHARFMMHNPFAENADNSKELKNALHHIREMLISIFESNSICNAMDLSDMLNKETWMSAQDAYKNGFVDEIITSKRKIIIPKTALNDAGKLYQFYNSIINKPKMDKVYNVLNLQLEASEEAVVTAIEAIKTESGKAIDIATAEIENLKKENEELKQRAEESEKKAAEEKNAKALELVENAIKTGKIKADAKDALVQFAKENYAGAKNMIEGINSGHANIMNALNPITEPKDERSEWSHRDWEIKDSAGLAKMKAENVEKYTNLFNKSYKN